MVGFASKALALAACAAPVVVDAQVCGRNFKAPREAPDYAIQYNGVQLQDVCITHEGPYHVFAIGDWGGISYHENWRPIPADKRSKLFPFFRRMYVKTVDDSAQTRVRDAMQVVQKIAPADYILNVGDNFYWGGIDGKCGGSPYPTLSPQFDRVFERVYKGNLAGLPWLGVLGNHDFGGYHFTSAWEKNIGYTWGGADFSTGRWFTPALYWGQRVRYPGFSVDYVFVDTNACEAWTPRENQDHNICGLLHSGTDATCGDQGPRTVWQCHPWFAALWDKQWIWLVAALERAQRSTFQIIVTHFPAKWFSGSWNCLAERYGIDLHISGHIHRQQIWSAEDDGNFIPGTCTIMSGGGGGITSEGIPSTIGLDDQYGFVTLHLTPERIVVSAVSHGVGASVRKQTKCEKRNAIGGEQCDGSYRHRRLSSAEGSDAGMTNLTYV